MLDRKKHRQEVESLKADNRMKDMELGKAYVDEFRSNIARPLQDTEVCKRLDISRATLWRKLKELKIAMEESDEG